MSAAAMPGRLRLLAMRALFLLTFIGLAPHAWPALLDADPGRSALSGVALSFWAALSVLALLGVLRPMAMLPLLLLQLSYKATWLATVGIPAHLHGTPDPAICELAMANTIGVVLDLLVIPWMHLWRNLRHGNGAVGGPSA